MGISIPYRHVSVIGAGDRALFVAPIGAREICTRLQQELAVVLYAIFCDAD